MNQKQDPLGEVSEAQLNLGKFAPELAGAGQEDGSQTLFIRRSAAEAGGRIAEEAEGEKAGLPVKDMLGVITYCYVRGVFSSKEIADRLSQDPELRKRFGRQLPGEAEIKAFRRRYAGEIEDLLETVFRAFPAGEADPGKTAAGTETEVVHRQAVERLHDAAWEDSMRRHLH